MRIQRSPKLVSNINGSPVLVQKVGIKTLKDPGLKDQARAEAISVSTQITRVQVNQSTTLELISVDTDAPKPTLSEENNTSIASAISAKTDIASVSTTPAAGLLTRQQYDAAVTNLENINRELVAARNRLNILFQSREASRFAEIRELRIIIARLIGQAASAKLTVDKLKSSF